MTGRSAPTGTPPVAESTLLAAPPSDASELLGPFRRRQSEISPRRGVMVPFRATNNYVAQGFSGFKPVLESRIYVFAITRGKDLIDDVFQSGGRKVMCQVGVHVSVDLARP
jgi:hypothetical protein